MKEADAEEEEENQIEIEHVESHCFNVGDKFSNYDELKRIITAYENNYSVQLYYSDSRTLEAAKKRAPRKAREAKTDLIYYTVNLCCVFGGRKYSNKGCQSSVQLYTLQIICWHVDLLYVLVHGCSHAIFGMLKQY